MTNSEIFEIKARILVIKALLYANKIRVDLKQKGDIHIINVHRFFGKWVEKSDKLREAVKAIIFGILYGKGTKTLARDLKITPEEAQKTIDKLFDEFEMGAAWLTDAVVLIKKYAHVVSPIGRVRNVWRVYTGKRGVIAAAARRAQNSPIQGFASEIGGSGSFQTLVECYKFLMKIEWSVKKFLPTYNRAVHDSALYSVPYAFVIPFIHIRQYTATNGITNWYKEVFGVEFTVEPEIELEVFASEDQSYKWDWEIPHLLTNIYNALQDQVRLGQLPADELESTWELILKPWKSKSMRAMLCEEYPLLNVQGLESNILEAVRDFKVPAPKEAKK